MECKYWVLAVRWGLDWVETHILRPGFVAVELGWSWGAILLTWMDVRHEMDGCEMPTSWSGCNMNWIILGHGWDVKRCMGGGGGGGGGGGAWMQVRQDMNGSKTHVMIPGWVFRLDLDGQEMQFFRSRMKVRRDLDGGETHISRPALSWVAVWMDVRVNITPGLYDLDPTPSRWQITSVKVPK